MTIHENLFQFEYSTKQFIQNSDGSHTQHRRRNESPENVSPNKIQVRMVKQIEMEN